MWLSGGASSGLSERLPPIEGVRVALGRPGAGLAGFRRSHQEAAATQRLARRLPLRSPLTSYDDVEVLALASTNEDQARDFVARTLGPLAQAPVEVRDTLRTYLRQECNLSKTAQVEFAHRNTVSARLDRARDLLPQPLPDRTLEVSLALEIARMLDL